MDPNERTDKPRPRHFGRNRGSGWRIAAAVAGMALVAVAAIRAAGWLVALCLTTAALLGSYAIAGGRSWGQIARGATALLPATVRGLGAGADTRSRSGPDEAGADGRPARIVVGLGVGAGLLLIFGGLFYAADPAFADVLDRLRRPISVDAVVRAALGATLVAAVALGAAYLIGHRPAHAEPVARARRPLGLAEWAIPVAMLDLLFAVFVWVQVTVLFAGDEYVLGPGGPDYAVYARSGFAQLGVVTLLTLGLLGLVLTLADRDSRLDLGLLRLLGGVLCGLTLVVVASALTRLALYADAYGFTVTRLLAYAGEVWVGIVLLLLVAGGVSLRTAWLPRAIVAAAVAVLIGLAAVNPEAVMARSLLARLDSPYAVDYRYLATLSADAVDEFHRLPRAAYPCRVLGDALTEGDPWYAWNFGRSHARTVLPTLKCAGP